MRGSSRTSDSWPSGSRPIRKRRSRQRNGADRHVASRGPVGRRCPPSTVWTTVRCSATFADLVFHFGALLSDGCTPHVCCRCGV